MIIMAVRPFETTKLWYLWWFCDVLSSFHAIFVSGTAGTPRHTTKCWTSHFWLSLGRKNITWETLVDPWKVMVPPLHDKLGFNKQFVRHLNKESAAFKYLQDFSPKLSEAKKKQKLNRMEKAAWISFAAVIQGFLGNHKSENYVALIKTLVRNYDTMGWRILKSISLMLIFIKSSRIWECNKRTGLWTLK